MFPPVTRRENGYKRVVPSSFPPSSFTLPPDSSTVPSILQESPMASCKTPSPNPPETPLTRSQDGVS